MTVRLGLLCGVEREARIARAIAAEADLTVEVALSAAQPDRAAECARALVAGGATHLLSFGLAGALVDDLRPGDLLLPAVVTTVDGERFPVDADWWRHAGGLLPAARHDLLLGVDQAARTPGQKIFLRESAQAASVDMESHHLARAAHDAGLPFLTIRAISDDRRSTIPQAAMAGVGPEGQERILNVILSLLHRPNELKALIRLGIGSGQAFRSLRGVGGAAFAPP
ncbi:hypothetical protein [Minwuia sp.]|uniref:phosphorylase family protein n=1 Tax=Minwuia sp. TaxID=2493630 RepID=UPI003A93FDB4